MKEFESFPENDPIFMSRFESNLQLEKRRVLPKARHSGYLEILLIAATFSFLSWKAFPHLHEYLALARTTQSSTDFYLLLMGILICILGYEFPGLRAEL